MTDEDREIIQAMIKQAVLTKDEIRSEIIKPLMMVSNANQEADRKVINQKLDMIITQTTKHNQRMGKIEDKADVTADKIIELEKTDLKHADNCPYTDNIRALEDNRLSQKTTKKVIIGSITLATIIIGSLITILKFITP